MKRTWRISVIVSAAVLLVLAGSGVWWSNARQDPNRIFWDMLANNLSTSGVTRVLLQTGQGLDVSQYTQISFGQRPVAHALTVFKENGNTLATEEISNQTNDFVRYQQISLPSKATGKALDTTAVLGKWARLQAGQTVSGQLTSGLFGQSLLDVLPIANLLPAQRDTTLQTMHQRSLFSYNPATVKKAKLNGREVYQYAVTIHPEAYVRVMQQFESLIGGTAYASLQPASFAKTAPIAVVISVDARSHTLSQLYETASQRTVRYAGYGATDTTPLPRATITTAELTARLAQLQ